MALFRGLQTILGSLLSILWDGLSGLFYDLPLMLLRGFASVASALASSIESIMPSWLRKGVTWAAGSDSGDTSETTPGSPSPAFAGAPSRARTSIEASFAPTPTAAAEPGQSLTAVLIGLQQAISRLASRGGQAIQVQLLLDGEVLHDQLVALSDQNAESNYLAAPGGA